jgi:tRNA(adenine34) deaminase
MEGSNFSIYSDEYFMNEALKQAKMAFDENEVPVGAVVVCRNKIIARAYNQTEKLKDATAHAEMLAITAAANHLGTKYLQECCIYVTLEPCIMCAGALYWSQMGGVVIGAADPKRGFTSTGKNLLHPKAELKTGVLEDASARLLEDFFRKLRN